MSDSNSQVDSLLSELGEDQPIIQYEDGYAKVDPRLKQLSYSSLLTLHSCPRKFQLYRSKVAGTERSASQGLTFAFGHMVGTGIQDLLEGRTYHAALLNAFLAWPVDLLEFNDKQHKSFWVAAGALRRFESMRRIGRLKDYELVYHEGKPACELSFAIHLPGGFVYRGFVDAVLRHKHTGKVLVLENKTTGSNTVAPATYKNSFQAIGYSIILDEIFPDCSAYEVLYLIYQTKQEDFIEMPFSKSYTQRARWLSELALGPELIRLYAESGIFPMHGEACYNFFSECEYYGSCHMSDKYLIPTLPSNFGETVEKELMEYQVHVSLEELIEAQILRAETNPVEEAVPLLSNEHESNTAKLLDDLQLN